jgi:TPR repeat protein/serine/threonine protein kinase
MKLCPICATSYPDGHRTCPTHGAVLVDTPELAPGTMIRDCYRIERTLGKGGMGIVYLAEHTLMGEQRALKFLSGALASNPSFVQRFLQEARASNKLRHPNIAQTLELGQSEDGSFYISMEFVDGPSLRALLDQSPFGLPPDRAFNIVHGVAEALSAAHAKNMVHRDIKPENILLAWSSETETAKVVDFGIVAITDSVSRLTQTGKPLMTAQYAAPEQWRGTIAPSELDGRTDLYSLGCMFFEMLTGQLPFHANSYEGWFEQHVHGIAPPPSQIRPELAKYPGLDALVLKLMAKEREDRPANVREFLLAMEQVVVPQTPGYGGGQPRNSLGGNQGSQRTHTVVEVAGQSGLPGQGFGTVGGQQGFGNAQPQLRPEQLIASKQNVQAKPASKARGWVIAAIVIMLSLMILGVVIGRKKNSDDAARDAAYLNSSAQATPNTTPDTTTPKPQASQPQATLPEPGSQLPAYVPQSSQPSSPSAGGSTSGAGPALGSLDAAATAKMAVGLYGRKEYAASEPLFEHACNGGHADSCDYLGWMYQYKLGVDQNYAQAIAYFDKGCGLGSMAACNNQGVMYQDHIGVAQDYDRAVALYTKACNADFAVGCDSLGYMYQFHEGVAEDYPRAVNLYTKACGGGSMNGCKNLGWMYQYNLGVNKDYPRAATLYTKACNGDNLEACNNLGYMYQHKLGMDQNYQEAMTLYTKACNGGEPSSCNSLGVMYEEHQGVQEDDARAVSYYVKACNGGNANGCSDLGNMYRYGKGVSKDTDRAKELLNKGCTMGSQWGCDSLKAMH